LTHVALVKLIPSIEDLPGNLILGLDQTFKFAYLEADSKLVGDASEQAINKCGFNPVRCKNEDVKGKGSNTKYNVATQRDAIVGAFDRSLTTIRRVTNDKYFGTEELDATAKELKKMTGKLTDLKAEMTCYEIIPAFCTMYSSSDLIVEGMSSVTDALDKFRNSDIVTRWDENKSLLQALHALPYFMVLGLCAFTLFWYKGGVCCCCEGGTKWGVCNIPFILLWLVSFILYVIVFAVGTALRFLAKDIEVSVLRGNPSLEETVEHFETKFSEFWNVVFADMIDGLAVLYMSSTFFTVVALLILLYSGCLCCCCPYRSKEPKAAEPAPAANAGKPVDGVILDDHQTI